VLPGNVPNVFRVGFRRTVLTKKHLSRRGGTNRWLFVSDEATIWDVSMAAPEEITKRCSEYYGIPVSMDDLKQPLWKLLSQLDAARARR
jgi:hypothetical protein